jgi:hemin uptake protein HemP
MHTEIPSTLHTAEPHLAWPQRKRISTTDLMQGAREVIIVHEGEEYILRITKTGKLILTK